jgi:hypothetical protein
MLSDSWPIHSSSISRAIYILSIFLVFSYIFFDVLDLDGSSFPRLFARVGRTMIVAVIPSVTQLEYSSEQSGLCRDIPAPFKDASAQSSRPPWAALLRASPLGAVWSHGYRVGLARNALTDSSPYL